MKIIQIDVCPEEMGQNVRSEVNLLGDCGLIVKELTLLIKNSGGRLSVNEWWNTLNAKVCIYIYTYITIIYRKLLISAPLNS